MSIPLLLCYDIYLANMIASNHIRMSDEKNDILIIEFHAFLGVYLDFQMV